MSSFRRLKSSFGSILKDMPPRVARQLIRKFSREEAPAYKKVRRKSDQSPKKKKVSDVTRCRCKRNSWSAVMPTINEPRSRKLTIASGSYRPCPKQHRALSSHKQTLFDKQSICADKTKESETQECKEDEKRSVVIDSELPYLINTSQDSLSNTIYIYHIKVC